MPDRPGRPDRDPVSELADQLAATGYIADRPLAMVLYLATRLQAPVLLEGEPGVGKTAVAEALAETTGARLVRLQCYEGLTAHHALYEWDYPRQLLAIRMNEATGAVAADLKSSVFGPDFLIRRPLLDAIWPTDGRPVVLLIDEIDRADEEFEALLLELLSQFQITIPEIGTITAQRRPTIVLTANRTRSLSNALRRRCLYQWIPFPGIDREIAIMQARLPGNGGTVAAHPADGMGELCHRLARALGSAPGRRPVTGPRGDLVDIRASLRHNLRFGEELILLQRITRRRDRPRVAALCDVSSSMMPHAPLFLAFLHSLSTMIRHAEAAVFNVELAIVTDVFRDSTLPQALRWMRHQQAVLAGGTRIGHCLHDFLRYLENRSADGPGTVLFILSDGWDVGEAGLLQASMLRLRRQVGRVIWCDPHAAACGFRPQVRALQAALPYVDDYLDFSSAQSLPDVVAHVETSMERKPR